METFRNKLKKRNCLWFCILLFDSPACHRLAFLRWGNAFFRLYAGGLPLALPPLRYFLSFSLLGHFAIVRNSEKCISRKRTNGISIFKVAAQFRVF